MVGEDSRRGPHHRVVSGFRAAKRIQDGEQEISTSCERVGRLRPTWQNLRAMRMYHRVVDAEVSRLRRTGLRINRRA